MKFIPYIFTFISGACFWEFAREAVMALGRNIEYRKTCKRLGTEYVIDPAKVGTKVPFRVPDKDFTKSGHTLPVGFKFDAVEYPPTIGNPIDQPQRAIKVVE